MNDLEKKVVTKIEEGFTRAMIAQEIGVGESTVRAVIRSLCEQYDCGMWDLPEEVRKGEDRGGARGF